jgi:ribosomal protein L24E
MTNRRSGMKKNTMPMVLLRWITIISITAIFCITFLRGQTYTVGDTLTFKVNGLVCSFCAHGLNKGIGKMEYTSKEKVLVDINNQIVKVILNKRHERLPSLIINQTITVIVESGYEVNKVFFNGRPLIK